MDIYIPKRMAVCHIRGDFEEQVCSFFVILVFLPDHVTMRSYGYLLIISVFGGGEYNI